MRNTVQAIQSSRFGEVWIESALWILTIILVLLFTRHLFHNKSLALFWGYAGLSVLTFIEEQHRFSGLLLGLGSDPVAGLRKPLRGLGDWFPATPR